MEDHENNLRIIENHPTKLIANQSLEQFGPQIKDNFELLKNANDDIVRQ